MSPRAGPDSLGEEIFACIGIRTLKRPTPQPTAINTFNFNLRRLMRFQINHQPDATVFQFIILTFIYSSICFGRFPAHHQELSDCSGSICFYLRIAVTVVLCSWSGRQQYELLSHCSLKRLLRRKCLYWELILSYDECVRLG